MDEGYVLHVAEEQRRIDNFVVKVDDYGCVSEFVGVAEDVADLVCLYVSWVFLHEIIIQRLKGKSRD